MDLNFYSDLTDGTGQHDGDPEFLDPQAFNGFDSDNKFPGGSDNYLTISGSGHPFLSSSECATKPIDLFNLAGSAGGTFHTPSLGDEEFEIPPISLDPDSALTVSDVVSHFGELSDSGPPDSVVVPGNAVVEGDDPSFASTFVNAPSQGLEHLSLGVINQSGGSALLGSSLGMDLGHPIGSQFSSSSPVTIDVPLGDMSQGLLGSNQLTTIDQSELSAQLGLGLGGGSMLQHPPSPGNRLSATASPTSSLQDDDMDDFRTIGQIDWKGGDRGEDRVTGWSRPPAVRTQPCYMSFPLYQSVLVESPVSLAVSPGVISLDPSMSESPLSAPTSIISPAVGRKGGAGGKKGKKKKDPNEPQKPVSAYALFFKDTQAAIKGQNPNATFGEVSKIVASMWDSLGEEQKQVYKRKNEAAKKDYLKALAEYRSGQISQSPIEVMDTSSSPPSPPPTASLSAAAMATAASSLAARNTRSQHYNPEENTITNICTSNIILDLPQVTTRSRTGATKPPPPRAPTPPLPNPPTVTKIIIKQLQLPSGVVLTSTTAPRQPPPLQQMQSAPPPPRLQLHTQPPPPLQAKPRASAPPPLQIKVVPKQPIIVTSAGESPSFSGLTEEMGQIGDELMTEGEEGEEVAEEGMEVEVNVATVPSVPPPSSRNLCVRAGCTKPAVENKDWDLEYCSNECVATHCRDVFMAWCAIRGQNSTTVT
ncbi:TOX high mobility group box family member 4-B [Dissostichus eleginoides]|uniref:TOX high mobility group box family member 4-B n=1 Tax=Dissostichus eleginoides TaxID=100907 RepID=A0AAD9BX22_DISEL|nr:TOX high mobility group box family member 4-B [Dissostichus eleginoides]